MFKSNRLNRIIIVIYGGILSILYAAVVSGQMLGFVGQFKPGFVYALFFVTAILGYLYYLSSTGLLQVISEKKVAGLNPAIRSCLFAAAIILFVLLVAVPLLRWPESPVGRELTWDAGAYHFPKAVELFRSGTAWDLSVAYGEYPFGYESLLALGLLVTGDESLFGPIHLLISIFFVLTLTLTASRYSKLPASVWFFFSTIILISGVLAGSERTWLISGYAFTVGKNDFLLGAVLLAVILHSPIGNHGNQYFYHLPGLAMSSMLAVSIKPNGAIFVLPVWIFILYLLLKKCRFNLKHFPLKAVIPAGLVMMPGILWAVRNIIVLGTLFTPAAKQLAAESIGSNILNPFLYTLNFPFIMLLLMMGITILNVFAFLKFKSHSITLISCSLILLITFLFTPATAFHRRLDVPSHIAWRFGITLIVFNGLTLFLLFESWLVEFMTRIKWKIQIPVALLVICVIAGGILWRGAWLLQREPENKIILQDEYWQPVGSDGYYSAYDYVQKNIRKSVIHVENGLMYYTYGPGYTNTPTKLQYPLEMADKVIQPVPDFFLIFKPDGEDFPVSLEKPGWINDWELIYSDSEGRLYQKLQ